MSDIRMIKGLASLAEDYDAIICDVWGVLHNGVIGYHAAAEALTRFRALKKPVLLLTNAPRPAPVIAAMLTRLGIHERAYDKILSSGDVTKLLLAREGSRAAFHLGPERDLPLFDGLSLRRTSEEGAELIVCTGLFDDETETPEDYRPLLTRLARRNLLLYCANPDLVVERGARLVYCAGALAKLYEALGGKVVMVGKPYPPVYEEALTALEKLAGEILDRKRILTIGDALATDVRGGGTQNFAVLLITAGIHAQEFGSMPEQPDPAMIAARLEAEGLGVDAAMPFLCW